MCSSIRIHVLPILDTRFNEFIFFVRHSYQNHVPFDTYFLKNSYISMSHESSNLEYRLNRGQSNDQFQYLISSVDTLLLHLVLPYGKQLQQVHKCGLHHLQMCNLFNFSWGFIDSFLLAHTTDSYAPLSKGIIDHNFLVLYWKNTHQQEV